jgi:hypothetical protein
MEIDKTAEKRVRTKAKLNGYAVTKSRERAHVPNLNNRGQFQLVDDRNQVALGDHYTASLTEIEAYLDEQIAAVQA